MEFSNKPFFITVNNKFTGQFFKNTLLMEQIKILQFNYYWYLSGWSVKLQYNCRWSFLSTSKFLDWRQIP